MIKKILVVASLAVASVCTTAETIGRVDVRGLFFKDGIVVEAFDDPTIKGAACYITHYDRWNPLSEDSSSTSIACRQVGPISGKLEDKKDVFSRKLNIFFKAKRVDRFYDKKRNVLTYLAYTRKMSGSNKSHSLSVIPVK